MDTITDVKHSRLQKDGGSDVTGYDASVKSSDTGWALLYAPVALLL
jgi:hypothetical protein